MQLLTLYSTHAEQKLIFFFFVNETGPEFSPRLLLVFCFVVLFLMIKASASLTEVNILYQHFCFGLLNQLLV